MYVHWDAGNIEHVQKHQVSLREAEYVVSNAHAPFPAEIGEGKLAVWGLTRAGRAIQVIYVYKPIESIRLEDVPIHERIEVSKLDELPYVIHARDLTPQEKRRFRRRRR